MKIASLLRSHKSAYVVSRNEFKVVVIRQCYCRRQRYPFSINYFTLDLPPDTSV